MRQISAMEILYVIKLKFPCESLQELRKHLFADHMKHLIQKGERHEEDLEKNEIIDIIQSTSELINIKHGFNANVRVRKPYSESVHEIFPQLSIKMIDAKLGQRMRNMRRIANQRNCKNTKKIISNEAMVTDNGIATDFEELVESFNIETINENSIAKSSF